MRRLGIGTQQVEKEVRKLFPSARVERMDSDTTAARGSHMRILGAFKRGEIDILLGTQMIAKGLDFPGVTLVGVISADTTLSFPDFRASEHTFQLLTQVAGRTGRGALSGEVIIQTHSPEHYAVLSAKSHDYEGFYKREMKFRRQLLYPPFSHLVLLTIAGPKQDAVESSARSVSEVADRVSQGKEIEVLGPAPAPLLRIRGKYRWQVILKGKKVTCLHQALASLLEELEDRHRVRGVKVIVDVDPAAML
jgi:primosomal protein N' (replication factor Y)